MGLLQKLLSTLGLRESRSGRGSAQTGETTVTVEHEPSTDTESAVKGTEGVAEDTDASGSTETITDTADEDVGAAEPSDAAGPSTESDEEDLEADAGEAAGDASEAGEEETADDAGGEAAEGSDESTDVLNGIGPAYAERLEDAGVETVGELASADAGDLADETGLGEGRIANWIEQAKEY